jgi:hypothetical protein
VTAADPPTARVLLNDRFAHSWPDNSNGTAWIASDGYQLFARTPGEFVAVRAPLADVPQDIVVSGTFHKVGGPPGGGYGLIVGDRGTSAGDGADQRGDYVVAAVGDRGEAGMWRRAGDRWVDIVPWTPSTAVHTDTRPNDLSVRVVGDRLTLTVNDAQVFDVGGLEVGPGPRAVGVFTGGDLNQVHVDRFRVETVAPGRPPATSIPSRPPAPSAPGPPPAPATPSRPPATPPPSSSRWDTQRARELMASIAEDIGAILTSLLDGMDNPNSPVNNPNTLKKDANLLERATSSARQLATELERIRSARGGDGH